MIIKLILLKWIVFFGTFLSLSSCSLRNEDYVLDRIQDMNLRSVIDDSENEVLNILGEYTFNGDFIEIVSPLEIVDVLEFDNIHEFVQLISENEYYLNNNVEWSAQDYSYSNISERYETYILDFVVTQKLDSEDENQQYIIKSIRSGLRGDLTGKIWNEFYYDYQIQFGTAIIDVTGYLVYSVITGDIAFNFFDYRHYKIIIDIHSGQPLNIIELTEIQ